MLTEEELAEIKAYIESLDDPTFIYRDTDFIVHARVYIPRLLEMIESLKDELRDAKHLAEHNPS